MHINDAYDNDFLRYKSLLIRTLLLGLLYTTKMKE